MMDDTKFKLALGTAQLGQPYGIANQEGKLNREESKKILKCAAKNNVSLFDTAPVYGNSEQLIGEFLEGHPCKIAVSTKLPSLRKSFKGSNQNELRNHLETQILKSLKYLKQESIDFYLIHDERDVLEYGSDLVDELLNQKEQGNIRNFGVSLYSPDNITLINDWEAISVLQTPINLFDHRFLNALSNIDTTNTTIFARSVFLQGLFFLQPDQAEEKVPRSGKFIQKVLKLSGRVNRSIAELALLFVRDLEEVDQLIVGVDTIDQLRKNVSLMRRSSLDKDIRSEIRETFSNVPKNVINPARWN